jgi:DNA-binding NarL/FixJ family response regulator
VLLVDDQPLVREGFRRVIAGVPDVDVVGEASDGEEAVLQARLLAPDVVVMDIRMPRLDGLEATRRILTHDDRVRVLVLTTFDLDEYVFSALRSGASGFLLKDAPLDDLVAAIRAVGRGDGILSPAVTRRVIHEFARRPNRSPGNQPLPMLSARERDVLRQVCEGLSNAEISARLYLTEATIKTHIRSMLAKLDLRDRTQLVIAAYESGFTETTG